MFWNLFKKELKYTFKNITFYVLIVIIGLFYFSQFSPSSFTEAGFKPPIPPEQISEKKPAPYGYKDTIEPKKEIRQVYLNLHRAYNNEKVYKTKVLLNVEEKLDDNQKKYIKEAMEKIASHEYLENDDESLIKVSYDEYLSIIRDLDEKLGGSTEFSDKERQYWINVPKTYEDAVKEYKNLIEKDKITNAGAREFSDYMGITAGLFPIFLAAFILIKDKRSKMQELICSRRVSSYTYVISKYAALCTAILVPYILFATHATLAFYKIAKTNNYNIDMMAFYKYTFWWILPTILFTVALGMLISVIFNNGIAAIPIQFILWETSMLPLIGDYSLSKFVIRFNRFGEYSKYIRYSNRIAVNRVFYIVISILLIFITALIWSKKRGVVGEHIK
ncbi:ABC transporter permease [Haloimpatiens sp. FM7330]|uniref:ABC transporter permease n=1 Tax=Haloimpatiens sp. FM7330 TaxID=3298610 RepID=UPI003641CEC3